MSTPISLSGTALPTITPAWNSHPLTSASGVLGNGPVAFDELLATSLQQVQALGQHASTEVQQSLVSGELSMVEAFTAIRESDLALKLMMQVRNKLVEGYQELQRMQM